MTKYLFSHYFIYVYISFNLKFQNIDTKYYIFFLFFILFLQLSIKNKHLSYLIKKRLDYT